MLRLLKKLGQHTAIFSLSGILSKGIGFLLLPLYTRYLSPADYGILELLALTLQVSNIILGQGLPMAVFRSYSFEFKGDKISQTKVVSTAVLYIIISSAAYCGFFFMVSGVIDQALFGAKQYSYLLRIIAITVFFQSITFVPNSLLRAELKSVQISIAQLIQLVVNLTLNIYFIVGLGLGIKGIIYGNLIAAVVLAVITYALIINFISFTFSVNILKKMLAFGLPFVPAGLSLFIMNGSDRFFLQKLSTSYFVGLYALGYKVSIIVQFILIEPFLLVWPSIYFPLAKESDAQKKFADLASVLLLVISFVSLTVILLAKPIIMVMAQRSFWDANLVCYWIVPSVILYGFYNILNIGINIKKKTKIIPVIIGCAALANLILNYFLIPIFGMTGAAASTLLSFFLMATLSFYFNNRVYPIPYQWGFIFKTITIFATCVILAHFVKSTNFIQHLMRFFIVIGVFIMGLFISTFWSAEERKQLFEIKNKIHSIVGKSWCYFKHKERKKI